MRRETILENFKARLATITKANGYSWEPKERIEWLSQPLNLEALPAILIEDTTDNYSSQASAAHTHNLSIEVTVYISAKKDTAKETRKAMLDILTAMSAEDGTDVGDYLRVEKTTLQVDKEVKTVGEALIEFVVVYETAKWEM